MAQFGKHLFGTSFFGKTSTFDGEYETEFIDAFDPFTGKIRVELDALLPFQSYNASHENVAYGNRDDWSIGSTEAITTKNGAKVSILACGDAFHLHYKQQTDGASAIVTFKNTNTEEVKSFTVNSSTTNHTKFALPYADYLVTVETTSTRPFAFEQFNIRIANVGIEARTATRIIGDTPDWGPYETVYMDLHTDNPKINEQEKFIGETKEFVDERYVQVKLHLATSESLGSPVVDRIHISSGDLSKHALAGYWEAAINFNNIAKDESRTFKRVKRVEWIERETEVSTSDIRSASVNSAANITSIPSRQELLNASYWKPETAPYILIHDGETKGTPWSRLSLAEAKNGFDSSATLGSVMIGPINAKDANLSNTNLVRWLNWDDQSYYPTNRQGLSITYELYKNANDVQNGYAPIFSVTNPESVRERIISLAPEDSTQQVFLRIQLRRTSGRQSPVVDYVDINAQMHYKSPASLGTYTSKLSPLDGIDIYGESGLGKKELRTVKDDIFDWPSLNQELPVNRQNLMDNEKLITMSYRPKYHNQVSIGMGENLETTRRGRADKLLTFKLFSQTTASSPSASTYSVPSNELFWHYSYDGGTVNFPLETRRDLSGQYTPSLINNKRYRFLIRNGWKDETFRVPFSMTLGEIAEINSTTEEELIKKNGQVKLYDEKVPMGYTILLPNNSLNNKVQLRFNDTGNLLTENSFLNGGQNDRIVAWIPEGGDYEYTDWVSDEVTYDGIINPNDERLPYVRTQYSTMNARRTAEYRVLEETELLSDIAKKFSVNIDDLKVANQNKVIFREGETVIIPGGFMLPEIAPGLIYEEDNPYVVEIIPGSVYKIENNVRLGEDTLIAGSDDEPAIQFTLKESPAIDVYMERGSIQNGEDTIPLSNVMKVVSVKNTTTGELYTPYSNVGGSHMGDYIFSNNRIIWSPSHSGSKEPDTGEEYIVTLTHGAVDSMRIVYTSDYSERMAQDRLWRSTDTKVLEGTVTPENDVYLDLPDLEEFGDYNNNYKQVKYIVEDNDLWVDTSIQEVNGEQKIKATMNGEDPHRNWYPTIQTGFYYLNDQEYYMYSEPVETTFKEKDVPILKNVRTDSEGLSLT